MNWNHFADNYDQQVRDYNSYGHDVLFGMCFEYVNAGQRLLDIGIGTGLASEKFSQIGLSVCGLDASEDMLNACRSKSFADELTVYNMNHDRIPYGDNTFDHLISCAALHFLYDLQILFNDVSPVMKPGGVFAFSIAPHASEGDFIKEDTAWGVPIFKHSPDYVTRCLDDAGLHLLKEQRLLIKGADKVHYDMLFSALVAAYPSCISVE